MPRVSTNEGALVYKVVGLSLIYSLYQLLDTSLIFVSTNFRETENFAFSEDLLSQNKFIKKFHRDLFSQMSRTEIFSED